MVHQIYCQTKRRNFSHALGLRPYSSFVFAVAMLIGFYSVFGSLGETEAQYNQRYGSGKVLKFDAQEKTKEIVYHSSSYANVWAHFTDGVAKTVQYFGEPNSMTDAYAESCLDVNAQGHKWKLMRSEGDFTKHWERDDGATAEEKPYTTESGEHLVSLSVWPPSPMPVPNQGRSVEHSFIHQLVVCLGIGVMFGGGVYAICWVIPFIMDKLARYLPRKQDDK